MNGKKAKMVRWCAIKNVGEVAKRYRQHPHNHGQTILMPGCTRDAYQRLKRGIKYMD